MSFQELSDLVWVCTVRSVPIIVVITVLWLLSWSINWHLYVIDSYISNGFIRAECRQILDKQNLSLVWAADREIEGHIKCYADILKFQTKVQKNSRCKPNKILVDLVS